MKGCRPLSTQEVKAVSENFTGKMAIRNCCLFHLGVNTGFRITELLSIRLGDVITENGEISTRLQVKKSFMKNKIASRSVLLNKEATRYLRPWLKCLQVAGHIHADNYVFVMGPSGKPISRKCYWKILKDAFQRARIDGFSGTHVMRKTYAQNVYGYMLTKLAAGEKVDPFRVTSKALGHRNIASTDSYLSFLTDDIDDATSAIGA